MSSQGGAIFLENAKSVLFEGNKFTHNKAFKNLVNDQSGQGRSSFL